MLSASQYSLQRESFVTVHTSFRSNPLHDPLPLLIRPHLNSRRLVGRVLCEQNEVNLHSDILVIDAAAQTIKYRTTPRGVESASGGTLTPALLEMVEIQEYASVEIETGSFDARSETHIEPRGAVSCFSLSYPRPSPPPARRNNPCRTPPSIFGRRTLGNRRTRRSAPTSIYRCGWTTSTRDW